MLEEEFSDLIFLDPPPYAIRYPDESSNLVLGLAKQIPRLLGVIKQEKRWLEAMHRQYHFDAVISDNRYGLRHKDIYSVIITHQVGPISGFGKLIDQIVKNQHVRYLRKFDECWIPDSASEGLAGKLSHPGEIPESLKFIGPLSRFAKTEDPKPKKDLLLIILSGPEPRRTHFEHRILEQLKHYKGNYKLVRGLPGDRPGDIPDSYNHLRAEELRSLILESDKIICRAGYTTIMDLAALDRAAVLVPTPGQTEQEYLAGYLEAKGYFLSAEEESFNLNEQVERLRNFAASKPALDFHAFEHAVDDLLGKLNQQV